ncbi:hypothetical protein SEA_FUNSIZED_93 [Mycobacterium phage Funsized]|nr:hypothetical protein SEA_FUNSIZED_93 [Mycobacterium phage Funsized]
MKWTRDEPGRYTAGPYTVEYHNHAGGFWTAEGPGVDATARATKAIAQADCTRAAQERITDATKYTAEAVVGDWAYLGGYLQITAVFADGTGPATYSLRTSRGKRKCLRRYEFPLVIR